MMLASSIGDDEELDAPRSSYDIQKNCVLHKMIFTNFKSYAGVQVVGPLDNSFTAVVGPNGSGKSNIIDGLLFVFGFRSSKLRQPKAIDLIHCSEEYPVLPFCSVKIIFHSLDAQNQCINEFTVERKVYRDTGRSEYHLNGMLRSLSEITRIMQHDLGIDLSHHRWLILQGEVESIAMMKPRSSVSSPNEEGLLEYLEDIIGSSALLPEIENCESLWNAASVDSNLAQGRLQLAEAEVQAMQPAADEALQDISRFNEIQVKRIAIMKFSLEKLHDSQKQLHEQTDKMHEKQKSLSVDIQQKKEVLSEHRSRRLREENERKSAQNSIHLEKGKVEQAERSVLKQKERHALTKRALDQADRNHAKMLQKSKEAIDAVEAAKEIPEAISRLQLELEKQRTLLSPEAIKKDNLLVLRQERATIFKQLQAIETVENEKVSLKNEVDTISRELNLLNQRKNDLKEEHGALERSLPELSVLVSSKEHAVMELAAEIGNHTEEVVEDDRRSLEYIISSMPGVIGRLGDLLSLSSDQYSIAFERAAGGILDNWVVESGADGQRCIDELRRGQLGRATFVVLAELPKAPNSAPNHPGKEDCSVVRLFDVIKPVESRLAPLAYYAARGETLVASTLDIGTQIAFGTSQRYRVVTIDGELIEPSGAMSGGGGGVPKRKKKASTSMHHQRQELAKRRQELEQSQVLLLEATQRIEVIIGIELPGLKERLASIQAREKDLLIRMETIKNETSPQNENDSLSSRLATVEVELSAHQKQDPQLELLLDLEERLRELEAHQRDINTTALVHVAEQALREAESALEAARQVERTSFALFGEMEERLSFAKQKLAAVEQQERAHTPALSSSKRKEEELGSELAKMEENFEDLLQSLSASRAEIVELGKKSERTREMLNSSVWIVDPERPSERLYYSERSFPFSLEQLHTLDEAMLLQLERQAGAIWQTSFAGVLSAWNARRGAARDASAMAQAALQVKETAWTAFDVAKRARLDLFMSGFREISDCLKSIYQIITLGGNAELELVDSLDPFSEGVLFSVMPPKKAWKNISQLSGGEKTLSSLALIFALHAFKPTPFYVMDEIDAALDFRNVSIIANFIKERTQNSQFIVVSLRNSMFEAANTLVGVYKTHNCTQSITVERALVEMCSPEGV